MVKYWIFIARRQEGNLQEMKGVIKNNKVWDFVSGKRDPITNNFKPRIPEYHEELNTGDYVLFYLATKFPDGTPIDGGRSIIGKARLGSPFVFRGEYFGEKDPVKCFVFLFEPYIFKFRREIEKPRDYGIGTKGRTVVPIDKNIYDSLRD